MQTLKPHAKKNIEMEKGEQETGIEIIVTTSHYFVE